LPKSVIDISTKERLRTNTWSSGRGGFSYS